jgi:hypothetical protein
MNRTRLVGASLCVSPYKDGVRLSDKAPDPPPRGRDGGGFVPDQGGGRFPPLDPVKVDDVPAVDRSKGLLREAYPVSPARHVLKITRTSRNGFRDAVLRGRVDERGWFRVKGM